MKIIEIKTSKEIMIQCGGNCACDMNKSQKILNGSSSLLDKQSHLISNLNKNKPNID